MVGMAMTGGLSTAIELTLTTDFAGAGLTLVFGQLIKNIGTVVFCPLLFNPVSFGMLARWLMQHVVLHEWFIDVVLGPIWTTYAATVKLPLDILQLSLKKIKERLGGNVEETAKGFLPALREWHGTVVADMVYALLMNQFTLVLEVLKVGVCGAAEVGAETVNIFESVVANATSKLAIPGKAVARGIGKVWHFISGSSDINKIADGMAKEAALVKHVDLAPVVLKQLHTALTSVAVAKAGVAEQAKVLISGLDRNTVLGSAFAFVASRLLDGYARRVPGVSEDQRDHLQQLAEDAENLGCAKPGPCVQVNGTGATEAGECCAGACRPASEPCPEGREPDWSNPRGLAGELRESAELVRRIRSSLGGKCVALASEVQPGFVRAVSHVAKNARESESEDGSMLSNFLKFRMKYLP